MISCCGEVGTSARSIELFASHHARTAFSCGNQQLDRYLHSTATQDKNRNIAIPYVIFDKDRQKIIGYCALSMSGINLEELPQDIAKKFSKLYCRLWD